MDTKVDERRTRRWAKPLTLTVSVVNGAPLTAAGGVDYVVLFREDRIGLDGRARTRR
jgi:hypothetical protein